MMNNKLNSILLGVLMLVGFTACSSEEPAANSTTDQQSQSVVSFTLDTGPKSKTRAVESLAKEAVINNDAVYVVAFQKNGGTLVKAVKATYEDEVFKADIGAVGLYDIFFVANANATLGAAILALTEGVSTSANLYTLTASQTAGTPKTGDTAADGYSAADDGYFLMTGKTATIAGPAGNDAAGTSLGAITMRRASVRIDVDGSAANFTLSAVKLNTKYTASRLMRGDETEMTDAEDVALTSVTNTGITGLNSLTMTGALYTYENTANTTSVLISGTDVNGEPVADLEIPLNTPLLRNRRYLVQLTPLAINPDLLEYTIKVSDWTDGDESVVNVGTIGLTSTPTITSIASTDGTVDGVTAVTAFAQVGGTITVTVSNTGPTLSKLYSSDQMEGFTISETHSGLVQTYTITIGANAAVGYRVFTFVVQNIVTPANNATFTVTQSGTGS